jgi:hypothetical protein
MPITARNLRAGCLAIVAALFLAAVPSAISSAQTSEPLPSWNAGPAKQWTAVDMKRDWQVIDPLQS